MAAPDKTYNNIKKKPFEPVLFADLEKQCREILSELKLVSIPSAVKDKEYFSFKRENALSMPINEALFDFNCSARFEDFLEALECRNFNGFTPDEITKILYTFTASVFSWFDIFKKSNKVRGTFFEQLISFLCYKVWLIVPKKQISISQLDGTSTKLPTDLVFDLGNRAPKFHVPCKTSTRERIIQVWAHQRVIDGVHGTNAFRGIPVLFAETKRDSKTLEVTEICLPLQWQLYQRYIAQMTRIYYFDIPAPYAALPEASYPIQVKKFGEFFFEYSAI